MAGSVRQRTGQGTVTTAFPRHGSEIPVGRAWAGGRERFEDGRAHFYEKAVMTVDMLYENGKLSA